MEIRKTAASFFGKSLKKSKVAFEHKATSRFEELFRIKECDWVERKKMQENRKYQAETDESSGKIRDNESDQVSSEEVSVQGSLEAHFKAYEKAKQICYQSNLVRANQMVGNDQRGKCASSRESYKQSNPLTCRDWICPSCKNLNFSFRDECNMCKWRVGEKINQKLTRRK